jgi:outer membrane protein OmpA-like peptidoglycan-associated protein
MRAFSTVLAVAALCLTGCQSTYQRTYDEEMQRHEEQRRILDQQQAEAQRQEARKYVAIVLFALNSAEIDEDGFRELDWFLEKIRPYPNVTIEVKGYTDSTGREAHNQPLSNRRAWAVKDYLISRGVQEDYIFARGYGAAAPARSNVTAAGRRQNRRAEVRVY